MTETHWTPSLKAAVVVLAKLGPAERLGLLETFQISNEELDLWTVRYDAYGLEGLKVTRIGQLRGAG